MRLAIKNIRVNCVAFGGVEGRVDESFKRRYADLCPMQRMLKESELAAPVNFFCLVPHLLLRDIHLLQIAAGVFGDGCYCDRTG